MPKTIIAWLQLKKIQFCVDKKTPPKGGVFYLSINDIKLL